MDIKQSMSIMLKKIEKGVEVYGVVAFRNWQTSSNHFKDRVK